MKIQPAGHFRTPDIWGVPLYIHWSFLIAGLIVALIATLATSASEFGPHFTLLLGVRKVVSLGLGMSLVLLVHEIGHIAAARAYKLRVYALHVSAQGGSCLCAPAATVNSAFLVYAAGLLAQLALLAGALVYFAWNPPRTFLSRSMFLSFTALNLVIMAINLIPRRHPDGAGTDSYVLWRLLRHRFRKEAPPYPYLLAAMASPVFPPNTTLLAMSTMTPPGFCTGIELLNDVTTPMLFVLDTFERHLDLSPEQANALMWEVHRKGGKLLAMPAERAAQAAARMTADAQQAGHPFICRAVGVVKVN